MADRAQVFFEATPNPQAMKFIVDRQIAEQNVQINDAQAAAAQSPLAAKIFGFPWCEGVMISPSFVTVVKADWVEWSVLAEPLSQLIAEHLDRGEAILLAPSSPADAGIEDNDPEEVKTIKEILHREIRPAVAMDGGDIVFHKYEDQVLYLYMQGSCAGCPSSTMTLKEGIQTRLQQSLPDLKDVIAV